MKIALMSDLHLEFDPGVLTGEVNDTQDSLYEGQARYESFQSLSRVYQEGDKDTVLVLAGDIGVGDTHKAFVVEMARRFRHVVFTAGNHEYYHGELHWTNSELQAIEELAPNISYLNPGSVVLKDADGSEVAFVGATLWTDYNKNDLLARRFAGSRMNDFNCIRIRDSFGQRPYLTPEDVVEINREHAAYMLRELSAHRDLGRKVVFISHHAPHRRSAHPRYNTERDKLINFAYQNTQFDEMLIKGEGPEFWLHGHTHDHHDYVLGDKTRVICNPRGYVGYGVNPEFASTFRFDV